MNRLWSLRVLRPSNFRLRVTRRLARSWTSWSRRTATRRLAKAERRLTLLQLETDRTLLVIKEQGQRLLQLEHREQELLESQLWREEQVTPELPESPLIPPLMAQQIREALEQELPPFQPIGLPRSPIFSPDSES